MTNEKNKLIKSLRAKINFGHPIYLWELLLCVKYILQEGNMCILNQLKPHKLRKCELIGICNVMSKTLYKLYILQNLRDTTPLTLVDIRDRATDDKHRIVKLLSRMYAKIYNTIPPRPNYYWFADREDRLKFLDSAIEKLKDSKECYILRGQLTIGSINNF